MATHRAFYVTQGSLAVWEDGGADGQARHEFADNDAGLREFDAYLAESSDRTSFIVIDVIEEEFAPDTIPKLGFRDRGALLRRRMQRKFPRTVYRLPLYQGPKNKGSDEAVVVHSAITNHELLDPWLQMILGHEVPLTGIYSIPLMAPQLLRLLHKTTGPVMLLTQHQGHKLRQVFMQDGHVKSARLSQSPAITDDNYPQFVLTEVGRSRRYLERTRLLSSMEQLDVYVVAHATLAERILSEAKSDSPLKIHFVKPEVAAKRVGLRTAAQPDRMEALYLAMSGRHRPERSYAVSGETRFWQMRRMRHAIIGFAVAAAAVCSVLSGLYLSDGWLLQKRTTGIEQQLRHLTETFRRENEEFDPIKADSHEMQLAVDTGDFILSNRLPVPWVMQQIGFVMGDYRDIQILNLGWSAESAETAAAPVRQHRGEQPLPVPVPAITAISANITASITPFDGNMRRAFAKIDAFASDLRTRTAFMDVAVIEYPLDARPQSSLSGEIAGSDNTDTARFQLRLRFLVPTSTASAAGANDEPV